MCPAVLAVHSSDLLKRRRRRRRRRKYQPNKSVQWTRAGFAALQVTRRLRAFSRFRLFPTPAPAPLTPPVGTPFAQQKESLNRQSRFIVKV
jgi:hypothetical protein